MTVLQKKQKIKKHLEKADNRLIDMLYAIIETDNQTTIGYAVDGNPLTRGDLKHEVSAAQARMKKGQFIDHNELIEKSKGW